jgi:hypothetical protein
LCRLGVVAAKYSLEALKTLRAAREEARGRELSERAVAVERARGATQERQRDLERSIEEREQTRTAEAERLSAEGLSAAELVRGLEHDQGQELREREQRQHLELALREEKQAASARDEALTALGRAHAEHEAVENHQRAYHQQLARDAGDVEDEHALDRWNGQHFGAGKS